MNYRQPLQLQTSRPHLTMHDLRNVHPYPAVEGPTGEEWWGLVATKRFLFCRDTTSHDDELIRASFR